MASVRLGFGLAADAPNSRFICEVAKAWSAPYVDHSSVLRDGAQSAHAPPSALLALTANLRTLPAALRLFPQLRPASPVKLTGALLFRPLVSLAPRISELAAAAPTRVRSPADSISAQRALLHSTTCPLTPTDP